MDKKLLGILGIFVVFIGVIMGIAYLFGGSKLEVAKIGKTHGSNVASNLASSSSDFSGEKTSTMQDELDQLSSKIVADLQAESRLNLNMMGQLRSYNNTLKQIQQYASRVEKDIMIIEEITKDEFQEDVKLQASLFNGKKSSLVARHLEEFRPSRVGAILSKMKEKEASAVLDVWAKQKDPKVSLFYRSVIASYLTNKRRDVHPDLFNQVKEGGVAEGEEREEREEANAG